MVNHVSKTFLTVPFSHPDSACLLVASKLLTNGFLHREIREKNGAYGGGCLLSAKKGVFAFYSYRDPSYEATLDSFEKSLRWLLSSEFSQNVPSFHP